MYRVLIQQRVVLESHRKQKHKDTMKKEGKARQTDKETDRQTKRQTDKRDMGKLRWRKYLTRKLKIIRLSHSKPISYGNPVTCICDRTSRKKC